MRCVVTDINKEAFLYSGTYPEEGEMQLNVLIKEGLLPYHKVLEIGSGALSASIPIIDYLDSGNFCGIEPNFWQVQLTLSITDNVMDKKFTFLSNDKFDPSSSDMSPFDYIISHSVLSHASYQQIDEFLFQCYNHLRDGGKAIFSLRLCDDIKDATMRDEWAYPDSVWITRTDFLNIANKYFSNIQERPDIMDMIKSSHDSAVHDWVVIQK